MIKIISDSTCDLSKELIEKYDIAILPLHIHLGEDEYQDGVTITPDEIYTWADANNTTPKTSAASMIEAIELFQPYIENGDEIISFSIASGMSANNNVMRLAAEDLEAEDKIHVIDSANLSTGIGLLVIEAAIMAKEGKTADEIVARIEELKTRVSASFVVDTLTYLHRGGRCSSVAALAGGALKIHPKIVVENGKMGANKKYRGKMSSVILEFITFSIALPDITGCVTIARTERAPLSIMRSAALQRVPAVSAISSTIRMFLSLTSPMMLMLLTTLAFSRVL